MKQYIYIDRDLNMLSDQEAIDALANENDQDLLSEDLGVFRVPMERWDTAQAAEWKTWMVSRKNANNDRNDEHFLGFDRYKDIRGLSFESAIELGCGPFTNMRFIASICQVRECSLLDPLIESYLGHPHCSYTRDFLFIQDPRRPWLRFTNALARRFPKIHRVVRNARRIPVKQIIASPIEAMPTDNQYDLLAIINVIEHSYDIYAVWRNIISVMKEDAFIIFHDRCYDHESVVQRVKTRFDAVHPLQVDRRLISEFLERNFTTVYERVETHRSTWLEETYDRIYYVGKKL